MSNELDFIGTHNLIYEVLVHNDPKTVHESFLKVVWWGGGFPWYLNFVPPSPPKVIQAQRDASGIDGIREVPMFVQEHIVKAELGKFVEYTLTRKSFMPLHFHRGQVNFYEAGPNCTRVVWRVNYTPNFYAFLILPFVLPLIKIFFLSELKKACEIDRSKESSFLMKVLKIMILLYVAFIISRALRLPTKPLHPGSDYQKTISDFRKQTSYLDEVIRDTTFFVTGGTGFTGSALVDDLRKRGAKKIKILTRSIPPNIEYPYGVNGEERYPLPGVEYVRGDMTDLKLLREALKGVDVVYHTATIYGFPNFGSVRGQKETEKVNFDGAKAIYQAAKESGTVKQIIYTSTCDTIFSGRDILAANETHPYLSLGKTDDHYARNEMAVGDNYARTKILSEVFLLSNDNKDGIRTVALRPNGIFGPGEFNAFKKASDLGYMLGFLPFYFDESQVSDWTCVYNLVYAHILATYKLRKDPATVGGKPYFITDEENANNAAWLIFKPAVETIAPVRAWIRIPSWILPISGHALELIEKFVYETLGVTVPVPLTRKEALKAIISHTHDNSRARKDLGYKPVFTTSQCQAYTAEEIARRYRMV